MHSDDQPIPEEAVGFNFHFQIANGAGRKACSVRAAGAQFPRCKGLLPSELANDRIDGSRIVDLDCRRGGAQPHDATLVAISTQRETINWRADSRRKRCLVCGWSTPARQSVTGVCLRHRDTGAAMSK
jgi:hypothetical protein